MALVDDYNKDVSKWTQETKRKYKLKIAQMTAKYSGKGYSEQKAETRKYAGEASRITFSFPYYMVFVHKGAGRGYGGSITKKFTRKDGSKRDTNPLSLGRMGTGRRRPKPWFNPILDARFPILADLVSNYKGDKVVLQIQKILIR